MLCWSLGNRRSMLLSILSRWTGWSWCCLLLCHMLISVGASRPRCSLTWLLSPASSLIPAGRPWTASGRSAVIIGPSRRIVPRTKPIIPPILVEWRLVRRPTLRSIKVGILALPRLSIVSSHGGDWVEIVQVPIQPAVVGDI